MWGIPNYVKKVLGDFKKALGDFKKALYERLRVKLYKVDIKNTHEIPEFQARKMKVSRTFMPNKDEFQARKMKVSRTFMPNKDKSWGDTDERIKDKVKAPSLKNK